jgi:type II secretory pathway component PulF
VQAFKYRGYDSEGEAVEGNILAGTIEEAERRIVSQDVTIIAILPASRRHQPAQESSSSTEVKSSRRPLSVSDSAIILQNLALMSETGVPFVEALEAASVGSRNPRVAQLLEGVKTEIVAGKSLSTALRNANGLFPPLVSDMVRVAEEGGRLDHALRTAAVYLERQSELRKRVMNALLYPIVMLSISSITVLVLIVFVMPRFATIFTRMGVEVPAATKFMLAIGDALRLHPLSVLLGVVIAFAVLKLILRSPAASAIGSRLILKLPMIGDLMKKLALSRAFSSLSTLLAANVPIMGAMEYSAKVAGVSEVRKCPPQCKIRDRAWSNPGRSTGGDPGDPEDSASNGHDWGENRPARSSLGVYGSPNGG